jgi:hypothetical protein
MTGENPVLEINRELARQINEEARKNPQSPYANKFVGLVSGKVVAVSEDVDDLVQILRQVEPDPTKCFIVETNRDYDEVIEIWSFH